MIVTVPTAYSSSSILGFGSITSKTPLPLIHQSFFLPAKVSWSSKPLHFSLQNGTKLMASTSTSGNFHAYKLHLHPFVLYFTFIFIELFDNYDNADNANNFFIYFSIICFYENYQIKIRLRMMFKVCFQSRNFL